MPEVVVHGGDEASYFATMVGTTLAQNVEAHPEKYEDFRRVNADVTIEVTDLDLAITLSFRGDRCTIRDGIHGEPRVRLRCDSDTFNMLGLLHIGPFGLPIYIDQPGRDVLRAMLGGKLRIGGMLHIGTLNRVTRLFSVV